MYNLTYAFKTSGIYRKGAMSLLQLFMKKMVFRVTHATGVKTVGQANSKVNKKNLKISNVQACGKLVLAGLGNRYNYFR